MLVPVVAFNKHCAVLPSDKLWGVDFVHRNAVSHQPSDVRSVYSGLPVALLDQAKTPVWGKLGVACNQEVEVQLQVKLAVGSGVDIC